jgi:NADPH:quinone reductase-like Zn-dependent oxidoreductase
MEIIRRLGLVHGMSKLHPQIGAFAEYFGACSDVLLKILDHVKLESAAGLGLGVAAAALGFLWESGAFVSLARLQDMHGETDDQVFVLVAN